MRISDWSSDVCSSDLTLTHEQVIRMVCREDSYSRVGLNALEQLYDKWPEHTSSLGLPEGFTKIGLKEVAWYAAMRERFPGRTMFGLSLIDEADQNLSYNGLTLRLEQEMRDYPKIGRSSCRERVGQEV